MQLSEYIEINQTKIHTIFCSMGVLLQEEAKAGLTLMHMVLSHVPWSVEQQAATFAKKPAPSIGLRVFLNSQGFSLLKRDLQKRG